METKWECLSCDSVLKLESGKKPDRCSCGNKDKEMFKFLAVEFSEEEKNQFLDKFNNENLLEMIKEEISKTHLGDNNLKMTSFLSVVSGLLKNPKLRKSIAVKGNSSVGKDNLIKSCLVHMPKDSYIFLTSGTQATIEDDIKEKRIIAFSELNANREAGANKFLVEVIKQKAEGGTSSLKKDIRKGMKEARHDEGEQSSVVYGTTEAEKDEELGTRFIEGTITTDEKRIKAVNDNTLDTFSDLDKLLEDSEQKDSWIRLGLSSFFYNPEQYEVYIPFAKFLKEKIDGRDIFDHSDARSQRDLKRLLALTCATTYLFQLQRRIVERNGKKILVAEIDDLINTLKYAKDFFNQSYKGMDLRINNALEFIDSKGKGVWVDKLEIQEHLGIKHRDTINKYLWDLEQQAFIERSKGVQLNERFGLQSYKGNHIYYTSVQKAFNKCLINVQLEKLKSFLEEKSVQKSVQFEEDMYKIGEKGDKDKQKGSLGDENEHLKLNTCDICGENQAVILDKDRKLCEDCFNLEDSKND